MTANHKGFEFSFNPSQAVLIIRAWGLWDAEFARKYTHAMRERIEKIRTNGKHWYVLVDFTELLPRSQEVRKLVSQPIATAEKQGMKKLAYLGKRSWPQLQFNDPSPPGDLSHAVFESEDDAIQWLLNA